MCSDDFDSPEFFRRNLRRARKQHRCDECWRAIPVGETYWHASGKWEGQIDWFRTHVACEELRDFVQDVVCGGHGYVAYGGLEVEILEAGQYVDCDNDAWEEAGLEPPNPLLEVFDFIKASYPAYERPTVSA